MDQYNPRRVAPNHVSRNRFREIDLHALQVQELKNQKDEGGYDGGGNNRIRSTIITNELENLPNIQDSIPQPARSFQTQSVTMPNGITDTYIYFDSQEADQYDLAGGKLTYSILRRNNGNPLQRIIEMEIFPFFFPEIQLPIVLDNLARPHAQPGFWFYNDAEMSLIEIKSTQSISALNQFRFHFQFDVQPYGIVRKFVPKNNLHIFPVPILSLNDVTFEFRAARKLVPIPQEVFTGTLYPNTTPVTFVTNTPHNLDPTVDHTVFFSIPGLTYSVDDYNIINNPNGIYLMAIYSDIPNNTTVNIDLATGSAAATGIPGTMYVGANKVAFTMRFRSLADKVTNTIVPV